MRLLHVFQPRCFGWKRNNALFTLKSAFCENVWKCLTFHVVCVHMIRNFLERVWGGFAFCAEELVSHPENCQMVKFLERQTNQKPTWQPCSPCAPDEPVILREALKGGCTYSRGYEKHDDPDQPGWRTMFTFFLFPIFLRVDSEDKHILGSLCPYVLSQCGSAHSPSSCVGSHTRCKSTSLQPWKPWLAPPVNCIVVVVTLDRGHIIIHIIA